MFVLNVFSRLTGSLQIYTFDSIDSLLLVLKDINFKDFTVSIRFDKGLDKLLIRKNKIMSNKL